MSLTATALAATLIAAGGAFLFASNQALTRKNSVKPQEATVAAINIEQGSIDSNDPTQWVLPYLLNVEVDLPYGKEIINRKMKIVTKFTDRRNAFLLIPFKVGQKININLDAFQPYDFTFENSTQNGLIRTLSNAN